MRLVKNLITLIFIFVCSYSHALEPRLGRELRGLVISSDESYAVAVVRSDGVFCGGVIVDEQWVLTAASCVYGQNSSKFVVNLDDPLAASISDQRYQVDKIIIHAFFNPNTLGHNIAILRVTKPMKKPPVKLGDLTLPKGKGDKYDQFKVYGFGHQVGDAANKFVQTKWTFQKLIIPSIEAPIGVVDLTNIHRPEYLGLFPMQDRYFPEDSRGFASDFKCEGNVGSPVFQNENDGKMVLIGILSEAILCEIKKSHEWYSHELFRMRITIIGPHMDEMSKVIDGKEKTMTSRSIMYYPKYTD